MLYNQADWFGQLCKLLTGLALSGVFLALMSLCATPAAADETCTMTQETAFNPISMDIVSGNGPFETKSQWRISCSRTVPAMGLTICMRITPVQPDQYYPTATDYYLHDTSGSKLIFSVRHQHGGNDTIVRTTSGQPSSRGIYFGPRDGNKPFTNASGTIDFTLNIGNRQRQNQVRSGTYSGEFTLVTQFTFLDSLENPSCSNMSKVDATVYTNFTVSANIQPTCQLERKDLTLDFGTVSAVAASKRTPRARTNIDVRCTYETPYSLTLDNGRNFSNGLRHMKSASNELIPYQLYDASISGNSTPWGTVNGKGGEVNTYRSHPIEAEMQSAMEAPPPGDYSDTVVITLTF